MDRTTPGVFQTLVVVIPIAAFIVLVIWPAVPPWILGY